MPYFSNNNEPSKKNRNISPALLMRRPQWVDDCIDECFECSASFSFLNRRHHCRSCGKIYCGKCSDHFLSIPEMGYFEPVRVCTICLELSKNYPLEKNPPTPKDLKVNGEKYVALIPILNGKQQSNAKHSQTPMDRQNLQNDQSRHSKTLSSSPQTAKELPFSSSIDLRGSSSSNKKLVSRAFQNNNGFPAIISPESFHNTISNL